MNIMIPEGFAPERQYILSVILGEFLGVEYQIIQRAECLDELVWVLEIPDQEGRIVLPDAFFSLEHEKWFTLSSLPVQPLKQWRVQSDLPDANVLEPNIPVIYGQDPQQPGFFRFSKEEIRLGLDVFGSAFFMLTRYEEMVKQDRDEHDRFPTKASLSYQEGFVERPIVNEYVEILWACLKKLWPELMREKRNYRLCLSHDVDETVTVVGKPLKQVVRRIGGDIVVRGDPVLALRSIRAAWKGVAQNDPCNTFDFIMDISGKQGIKSTFNFMTDLGHTKYDQRYSIDHPWVRLCLQRIVQRGHLIGFHPTYGSYLDAERTKTEFLQLKKVAKEEGAKQDEWGGRQHYLRWQNPETWQHWDEAGIDYDSTVGFSDLGGFRTGCCYEYPVFNLKERKQLNLRERSLIVIESAVLGGKKKFNDELSEKISSVNHTCKRFAGDFTLLWHNVNLISRQQRKIYASTLDSLR